jgi:quercetin dioxygenase-like cupin family protein
MKSTKYPDVPRIVNGGAVITVIGDGERVTLVRFDSQPGTVLAEHSHPHEQVGTCVKGKGKLVSGGKTLKVEAGVTWVIPPNEPHSFAVEGTEPALIFEVFSPIREDFLKNAKKP